MKKSCVFFIAVLLFGSSCLNPEDPSEYTDEEALSHDSEIIDEFVKKKDLEQHEQTADLISRQESKFEARVFALDNPEEGFGYNIIEDGKLKIQQATIPSIPGNKGFSSEEKARRTAEFVIYKMQNKIFPPSVDKKELDSLGVLD